MKLFSAFLITLLVFLNSCTNESNKLSIEQIGKSVNTNNEFIARSTLSDLRVLENNLVDPVKKEKTEKWQPISLRVHEKTLMIAAQIKLENGTAENAKSVSKLSSLKQTIDEFQETLLKTDPEIVQTFANEIKDFGSSKTILIKQVSDEKNKEIKQLLKNTIQNKALLLENKIVAFCKNKTEGGCILRYDKFSVLIGQNTNQLKRGETLEISAGVGAYSMAAQAKISFNGFTIPTINGVSTFKLKTNDSPGKHSVPVNIIFINENGETVSGKYNIDYTIY